MKRLTQVSAAMKPPTHKVRTPIFPLYSEVRKLLPIFEGVPKALVTSMIQAIWEQTGTPQNPVDWTDPDKWIEERLSGEHAGLARRIWLESGRTVNPRHIYGAYLFINQFALAVPDPSGRYRISQEGDRFLAEDPEVVRRLDDLEGLLELLRILSTKDRARRADLIPEWGAFLEQYSRYGTSSTIKDTLRRRVLNLVERGLVARDGNTYWATPRGLEYAAATADVEADRKQETMRVVSDFNARQRDTLRKRLGEMPPYHFEKLIRDLLEAMGYEDVTVTKESGDKGVDVVATVQFGITTITEVVQVKRHQGTIHRPTLDQLRGALPYHKAIRGTLITTGAFSKGCTEAALFPGAAPIGLIDGPKLLDLLMEHEIGIQKRTVPLYELDDSFFTTAEEPAVLSTDPADELP